MKFNRFRSYVFVQGFVVLGVTLIFGLIADRAIAALCASSLFILSSCGIIGTELTRYRAQKSWWVLGATGFFLIFFIIPIVTLRISHWGVDFNSIQFMGISARDMHRYSNIAFMFMLMAYFVEILKANKKSP